MSKKGGGKAAKGGPVVKLDSLEKPAFWEARLALFDRLYAAQQEAHAALKKPIKVTLPDGKQMDAEAWETTPVLIAKKISNSLADKILVAKVDDQLWDATRVLEQDCQLELLTWDDVEGQKVFWHSAAHILGYALERTLKCKLSVGPALEDGGYFYEGDTERSVADSDYPVIHSAMQELVKQKAPYQRLLCSKAHALELFSYSEFKTKILASKVKEDELCTVYKCGQMIDPCRGPHLPDTGRVKAFAVTKNSSSYFEGNAENAVLQRVYGIAFPKEALLKEWLTIQEEAAKRDHRNIGKQQDLFGFHDVSPGSAFWLPHGTRIYNSLIEFIRKQYRRRGFEEVLSPNIFNAKLWMVSGHWQHYKDAMFQTECEHEVFGMKPMNCPGHCILYGMRPRSYKDLPIRFAEFGVLHRNELSGALTGLTRVRRFQQDDAHIFCRMDQIEEEMIHALDFLSMVYGVFGFKFHLKLSTRPDNAIGTKEMWDVSEARLLSALNDYCEIPNAGVPDPANPGEVFHFDGTPASLKRLRAAERKREKEEGEGFVAKKTAPWELNAGDGAFYGPKIDICVEDALRRKHQCATIQLDFTLPQRFGLKYTLAGATGGETEGFEKPIAPVEKEVEAALTQGEAPENTAVGPKEEAKKDDKDGADVAKEMYIDRSLAPNQARPVMIHRAILGSLERSIAILCEHFGGKWPLWMSPRQVVVIPVTKGAEEFAKTVKQELHAEGFFVDVDDSNGTLEKKIRNSQLAQYNFILVCGEKEMEGGLVDVRTRNNERHGQKTVKEMGAWLKELCDSYSRDF